MYKINVKRMQRGYRKRRHVRASRAPQVGEATKAEELDRMVRVIAESDARKKMLPRRSV